MHTNLGLAAAEIGVTCLGLVALVAAQAGARRSGYAILALALAWAGGASLYRASRTLDAAMDVPPTEWAGLASSYLAADHRTTWLALALAGAVVGVAGFHAARVAEARPGGGEVDWDWRGAAPLAVAAALVALGGPASPGLVAGAAVLLVAAGVALRSRVDAIVPASLAAGSLAFAADGARWTAVVLDDPHAAAAIDRATYAGILAAISGVIAIGWALARIVRERRPALAIPAAAILVWAGVLRFAESGTRTFGPPAELAALDLPVHVPARTLRMPGGCLVGADRVQRTVGKIARPLHVFPCPPDGTFAAEALPWLAVPGSAPIEVLTGHHAPDVGAVWLLVRPDAGWSMPTWRVLARPVLVWEASASPPPSARPLPGAVLVVPGGPDPAAVVRGRPQPRLDVLVHATAAPTVDAFLRVCAAVEAVKPAGIRCILATGDVRQWRIAAGAAPPPANPDATWETVEGEPEDGFH